MVTDKGPMKVWVHKIGRAEDNKCGCGIPQNAAHLLKCTEVGDGKGRSREEMLQDEEWLSAVHEILEKNREEW